MHLEDSRIQRMSGAVESGPPSGSSFRIEPTSGWRLLDLRELIAYRDLFYYLVKRDVTAVYKQSVLGIMWAVFKPLFQMIVFSVVFGRMVKIDSDGVPYAIFSYVALVPWTYFSGAMNASTTSLVGSANMITKVYFPRMVIPVTPVLARLVDFFIAFAFLGVLCLYFGVWPTWKIVFLPLLLGHLILTALGIGMWLSSLAVQYRDVRHMTGYVAQLLMYAAPIIWPMSMFTESFGETARLVYALYPVVGVIEGFRSAILDTVPMPWDLIAIGSVSSLCIAISGAFYFRRMERRFADVA